MANEKFADLLDAEAGTAKPPMALPGGLYTLQVQPGAEFVESSQKQTPGVQVLFKPIDHDEDVDEEELNRLIENDQDWRQKTIRESYWLTPEAIYRLEELFAACGIEQSGRTRRECIAELQGGGQIVKANITRTPGRGANAEREYNNLAGFVTDSEE